MDVSHLENNPAKLQECLSLIEKSFSYDKNYSYQEDFQLLINKDNLKNCFYLYDDAEKNEVVCTVFSLPRVLTHKENKLPVLFIGGISVNEKYRGQGHFKTLLEAVIALNSDKALFLLWSDLSQMYEKFNFYEFGLIEEIMPENNNPDNLNQLSQQDFEKLRPLYYKLSSSYIIPERKEEEWSLLWQTNSIKKLTNGHHIYFVDKGMDLRNIIHESYPLDINNKTPYSMWKFINSNDDGQAARYTGFMRLGNVEELSHFVSAITGNRLFIQGSSSSQLDVIFDGELYHMNKKDFIQGLWGPGHIEEWNGLVPPLIIFGFDSI